ncbi:MAG: TIGR04282 family arsenosugar biosynthesis glycosyltransferase, partial [Deltaproteobacteria bacterium]|nr:TIGR04282 family arsenosugar biosynthesis glycosyltransferase [Deltaproteobacteria bacterium]
TPKGAAGLYECFIQDIFSRISVLNGIDIIAAYTPQNLISRARRLAPSRVIIIPQKGKDLGERLQNIFYQLFSIGYKKIAIIGTDSPDLPIEYIEKSFSLLNGKKELVLGPAEDGGYYLIAMSRNCNKILKGIPWSTNMVFEKTIKKAEKADLTSAILPRWYDVDDIESLKTLRKNIKNTPYAIQTSKAIEHVFKNL